MKNLKTNKHKLFSKKISNKSNFMSTSIHVNLVNSNISEKRLNVSSLLFKLVPIVKILNIKHWNISLKPPTIPIKI